MDKLEIERKARELQGHIWQQRKRLWPDEVRCPIDMLDPEIAAHVLDVSFEYHEELGRFGYRGVPFEIAGFLDRQSRKIAVSRRFPPETIRFTGAHEIGHWLLHPDEVMHRDRPIKGLGTEAPSRAHEEKEADYFAACFLMPRKLVISTFKSTFSTNAPFVFDDDAAFRLCPSDPELLLRPDVGSLDRAVSLAHTQSYGGRHFNSLSQRFRVSVKTMAIRLTELGLIQE